MYIYKLEGSFDASHSGTLLVLGRLLWAENYRENFCV